MSRPNVDGFPRGWFVVAFSKELPPGDVRPMRYFGRDLVLYRTEDGEPVVLDAHCPHLGAHLGHGGRVDGDRIVCPFHAWEFGRQGQCQAIPYASKIPGRAALRSWPVCEVNDLIFVWHHPNGLPPEFEIPPIPEYGTEDWSPWFTNQITVESEVREVMENVADRAHFPPVHSTNVHRFDNEFTEFTARQWIHATAYPKGGGKDEFELESCYYGPAYQISHMHGVLTTKLLLAHTPIETNRFHLRFGACLKKFGDDEKTEKFAAFYVDNLTKGFHEDIDIWEHKVWRDQPRMCDGDGPFGSLRSWYRRFYDNPAEAG